MGVDFGTDLGLGFGVAFGFGVAVAVGDGFGVGNSISLFAVFTTRCSSSASSDFNGFGSGAGVETSAGGDALSSVLAARSCALPSQTMLCGFDELLAARLQRINPRITATCARAISVTFRQKRPFFAIYFVSALVAMPTLVIPARCTASMRPINFCTGRSRSGRITTATSGFVCFNWANCAVSVSKSTT